MEGGSHEDFVVFGSVFGAGDFVVGDAVNIFDPFDCAQGQARWGRWGATLVTGNGRRETKRAV
jgi:hypothetical protein